MPPRLSVLSKPRDVHIKNFLVADEINNIKRTKPEGSEDRLRRLYNAVAPNAILNAGGRGDTVRCHPGTRERVIGVIETWMDGDDEGLEPQKRIMWLNGPAGAGKSAIMQTVAERQKARGGPAPNFFFFRGDDTRNNAKHLVATLLYQLMDVYPVLKRVAANVLTAKPLVLQESIPDQFTQLIASPMETITRSNSTTRQSITLLIDGLDECSSSDQFKEQQQQILLALHDLVARENSPFRVLVASRREPHLIRTFSKMNLLTKSLELNNDYRPGDDIRTFVAAKFSEIKTTHHLSHHLEETWPSDAAVDEIVTKSSGQFIYAATVMRFLESSSASPKIMLKIILGLKSAEDHSPFAQLDAMYSYILSQARNEAAVKLILGVHLISLKASARSVHFSLQYFFDILCVCDSKFTATAIESYISDLTAIAKLTVDRGPMRLDFYHASFGDYITDQLRSGVHHVDLDVTCRDLCLALLLQQQRSPRVFFIGLQAMDEVIMDNSPTPKEYRQHAKRLNQCIMSKISELYLVHHRDKYEKILRRWVRICYYYDSPVRLENAAYPLYKRYTRQIALEMLWLKFYCRMLRHIVGPHGTCATCMARYFKLPESIP